MHVRIRTRSARSIFSTQSLHSMSLSRWPAFSEPWAPSLGDASLSRAPLPAGLGVPHAWPRFLMGWPTPRTLHARHVDGQALGSLRAAECSIASEC